VTSDPAVLPLRELVYLPKGAIDPHGVPDTAPRAGRLPEQVLATLPKAAPAPSAAAAAPAATETTGSDA
jgi:NAD(P)H-quinone oxidoreductase subunit I